MTTVPEMLQRSITITDTPETLDSEYVGRIVFENTTGKTVGITLYQNDVAGAEYLCLDKTTYQTSGMENADQVEVRNATDAIEISLLYTVYGT